MPAAADARVPTPVTPARPDVHQARRGSVSSTVGAAAAVGLAAAFVLGRAWRGGWLLLLDATPGPRSVPSAGLPAGPVTAVVLRIGGWFGSWVGAVPVVVAVVAAALGASWALVGVDVRRRPPSVWAVVVVSAAAVANPFVATRVYAGQIGVLLAYASLFWLVGACLRAIEAPDSWHAVVPVAAWWSVAAACTLQAAFIGAVPVAATVWMRHRRLGGTSARGFAVRTSAVAAVVTTCWVVPSAIVSVSDAGSASRAAAAAFSSRGTGLTAWFGALTGAGFWRTPPDGLATPSEWLGLGLLLLAVIAVGAGRGWQRDGRAVLGCCLVLGATVSLAGHGATRAAWGWAVEHVAVVGLHREPGKWSMVAVVGLVLAAGIAAQRVGARRRQMGVALALAVVVAAGWSLVAIGDHLRPSRFPAAWSDARAAVDDGCRIAVLGDGAYVDPGFTDGRVVANPARGFFGSTVVVDRDTGSDGIRAARHDSAAQRWVDAVNPGFTGRGAGAALVTSEAAAAGIGWVFVARPVDEPALVSALDDAGFAAVVQHPDGGMWRVPGGCG